MTGRPLTSPAMVWLTSLKTLYVTPTRYIPLKSTQNIKEFRHTVTRCICLTPLAPPQDRFRKEFHGYVVSIFGPHSLVVVLCWTHDVSYEVSK